MTDPEPKPSNEPSAAPTASEEPRSYAPLFLKIFGWSLLAIVLGVGVLIAGRGDFSTVGSALAGIVILLLVLSSSGLTGFWDNKS
jgi:hypothetical protein